MNRADVARHVAQTTGAGTLTEETGGGNTALVTALEGGALLVIASNFAAPAWGDTDTTACLFATVSDWTDGYDPINASDTDAPLTPAVLSGLIAKAMAL